MEATDRDGGVRPDELEAFRAVGAYLTRRGLIRGSEGNLSTCAGDRLAITRTGCRLDDLGPGDVLVGTLSSPPAAASSDLALHLEHSRDSSRPAGAVVHAHPPGSVPEGWVEGQLHGVYALGRTLEHAAASLEHHLWVADRGHAPLAVEGVGPVAPALLAFDEERTAPGERAVHRGPGVSILDQTRLPGSTEWLRCDAVEDVADAIRRLAVRGAPALGVAAAFGVTLAAFVAAGRGEDVRESAAMAGALLVATRPTAVNIRWAVNRLAAAVEGVPGDDLPDALLAEARAVEAEDAAACSAMGWAGAGLIPEGANVLTHCNTGMLCTAGIGTAFGALWCAHLAGKGVHVWVDETRPLLQGARITAWELDRLGVPFTLIPDAAAASLIASGRVDAVILGSDRIAANGDVANKVGTYPLAVLASRHGVPFYVVAPTSTVDLTTSSGADIAIEERDPGEVTHALGTPLAPEGAAGYNPAFDVTPAELVTAIVTERGIVRPPFEDGLRRAVEPGT